MNWVSERRNPTPCIVMIVPVSVAITYRTQFNYISQKYLSIKSLHGFIYYIIPRIVIRVTEYKPLGLKRKQSEKRKR